MRSCPYSNKRENEAWAKEYICNKNKGSFLNKKNSKNFSFIIQGEGPSFMKYATYR